MTLLLAHAGHWLVNTLYAAPMAAIGGVLWWSSRREQASGLGQDDDWRSDPRLDGTDPGS